MKRWNVLGLVLLLVLVLSASAGFAAKRTVELSFWTFVQVHADFMAERVAAFNETRDDVEIKLNAVVYPYAEMHDKLLIALQSGVGAPDIVDIEIGKFGIYLKGDIQLIPLNDLLADYEGVLVPERMNLYAYKGNQYGLDWHLGTFVAYYNKELMDAAGVDIDKIETWDDFIAAGKKVTGNGKWMTAVDTIGSFVFIALAQQNGGGIYDKDGNVILDSEANVEALKMVADWVRVHKIAMPAPSGLIDEPGFFALFNEGNIGCLIMPQWYMTRFTSFMPDLEGKIVIRPIPAWYPGGPRATMGGGTGTVITNQIAKDKLQVAKDLMEFCKLTYEAQVKIWTDLGFDPYRYDVFDDPRLQVPDPYFGNESVFTVIKSVAGNMMPQYVGPFYADAWSIICEDVVYGAVERGEDPATLLRNAARRVRSLR